MTAARLKIHTTNVGSQSGVKISIVASDGTEVDLTDCCVRIALDMSVNSVNRATLELMTSIEADVVVDANVLVDDINQGAKP